MNTPYLLLILVIVVIIIVYIQKKKQIGSSSTDSTSAPSTYKGSIEKYTVTPNQLLSTDSNGNLSVIPVSSVVSPSLSNNFDDNDSTNLYLNNVNLANHTPNRNLDLMSTEESIYLMGKKGTVVSANAGSGNLIVQGNITVDKDITTRGGMVVEGDIILYGEPSGLTLREMIAKLRADLAAVTNRVTPVLDNLDKGMIQLGGNLQLMSAFDGREFRIRQNNNNGAYIGMAGFGGSS